MTRTMRAAVLEEPFRLSVRDIPVPLIKPNELLIRVGAVGLCGTDIHIFRGEGNYNMDSSGRLIPLSEQSQILGHEFCGEVVMTGDRVQGYSRGDRVLLDQGLNCHSLEKSPVCEYCETGDSHQCSFYQECGITGVQGAMAEYIAIPAVNAIRIGGELSYSEAVMSEPLACVLHSCEMMQKAFSRYSLKGERPIRSILICGSGPAGLLFTRYLRGVLGFDGQILVADMQDGKLQLALQSGATVIDVKKESLIEAVEKLTSGRRVECLIDACGSAQLLRQVPWLLRKQGTLLLYGHGHRGQDIGILNLVQFLEPSLVSPVGASGDLDTDGKPLLYERALHCISKGQVTIRDLITHRYSTLESLQRALTSDHGDPDYVKGILQLTDDGNPQSV